MTVSKANIEEFKAKEGIQLLSFKAAWCGPCRMLGPVLEEIDEEEANITVGSIDVDTNEELSAEFSVRNIPTTFIIKDGVVVGKIIGGKSKSDILAEVKAVA